MEFSKQWIPTVLPYEMSLRICSAQTVPKNGVALTPFETAGNAVADRGAFPLSRGKVADKVSRKRDIHPFDAKRNNAVADRGEAKSTNFL